MKAMVLSALIAIGIAAGTYYMYVKHGGLGGAASPGELISTTGVRMDLITIANAEREYFALNGTYATMDQLNSSGSTMRTGRDGYTYTVEPAGTSFTATAKWSPPTPSQASLHYPTLQVDQTNEVHEVQ
jgi:hypothetical protein